MRPADVALQVRLVHVRLVTVSLEASEPLGLRVSELVRVQLILSSEFQAAAGVRASVAKPTGEQPLKRDRAFDFHRRQALEAAENE